MSLPTFLSLSAFVALALATPLSIPAVVPGSSLTTPAAGLPPNVPTGVTSAILSILSASAGGLPTSTTVLPTSALPTDSLGNAISTGSLQSVPTSGLLSLPIGGPTSLPTGGLASAPTGAFPSLPTSGLPLSPTGVLPSPPTGPIPTLPTNVPDQTKLLTNVTSAIEILEIAAMVLSSSIAQGGIPIPGIVIPGIGTGVSTNIVSLLLGLAGGLVHA